MQEARGNNRTAKLDVGDRRKTINAEETQRRIGRRRR